MKLIQWVNREGGRRGLSISGTMFNRPNKHRFCNVNVLAMWRPLPPTSLFVYCFGFRYLSGYYLNVNKCVAVGFNGNLRNLWKTNRAKQNTMLRPSVSKTFAKAGVLLSIKYVFFCSSTVFPFKSRFILPSRLAPRWIKRYMEKYSTANLCARLARHLFYEPFNVFISQFKKN